MPRHANRLANETSPYLLQHANNPVDWYPWGAEALGRAREEDKPILLSIGYAACHWCHVMERESFQDADVAQQMNRHFVCIKVDREERPDLDDIYMQATVALAGSGGWPMTVFLTPGGEPFFAGTYFPPRAISGRPGFVELLERIAQMWSQERSSLLEQAKQLTEHVRSASQAPQAGALSTDSHRAAARALARQFDSAFGGFGRAPKFPAPAALSLLLRQYRRTDDGDLLAMVQRTLDGMLSGGIYDQLGGGFARYSVDEKWLVPHFEKMLYDNAQLADVYLEAFQATGHGPYRRVARETLDYVLRDMTSPEGGFFSSSDADSEGEEGRYFVWTRSEIVRVLGQPQADHFCAFYGVSDEGNFEGKNVLTTWRPVATVARDFGVPEAELVDELERSRQLLLERRASRPAPSVDDKIVTGWNGLMIRALSNGARVLGDRRYLAAAEESADFLLSVLSREDGRLLRTARHGQGHTDAFLEDYAYLIDGLLCLYEAGGPAGALLSAHDLAIHMLDDFSGPESEALYGTSRRAEPLLTRPLSGHDGALVNANAVACRALARLSVHLGRDELRQRAEGIAKTFASAVQRAPQAYCGLLCAVDFLVEQPLELVFAGDTSLEEYEQLVNAAASRFLPNRVEAHAASWRGMDANEARRNPLLESRCLLDGPPQAFVCEGFRCQAPTSSPEELAQLLSEAQERHQARARHELGRTRLPGMATAEGTKRFVAQRLPKATPGHLGPWTIARLGVGSYRVGLDHPDHRAALTAALQAGLNLVDTSPSFAWGDSQRLVGEVLAASDIERAGVVIVSKLGVAVGGEAEELTRGAWPDQVVTLSKDGSVNQGIACLQPEFLNAQLERSLERLGLEALDVCLLQSPEHLLTHGVTRTELEERIRTAFEWLELQVEAGRVGRYGVLTNTATRSRDDPTFLDVERLCALAREIKNDHHFAVLQVPVNLIEHEPLRGSPSLIDRATGWGLDVLAVRPLSALADGKLTRLVDPPAAPDGASADSLSSARYRVASLEAEFETRLAPQLRLAKLVGEEAILPLSGALGKTVESVESFEQFKLAETTLVTPRLRAILAQLDRVFAGQGQEWPQFRKKYVEAVGQWLAAVRETAKLKNRASLDALRRDLPDLGIFPTAEPGKFLDGPFVGHALELPLRGTGLAAAIVGLRSIGHVTEAIRSLERLS